MTRKQFNPDPASGGSVDRPCFQSSPARCGPLEQQFQLNPQVTRQVQKIEEKILQKLRGQAPGSNTKPTKKDLPRVKRTEWKSGKRDWKRSCARWPPLLREIDDRREALFRKDEQG